MAIADRIWTTHQDGKELLVLDYSGLDGAAYKPMMAEAIRAISSRPKGTVLTLTNVQGTRFGVGTAEDIKAYSAAIRPYVKASAVFGVSSLQRVIYVAVKPFLSPNLEIFATEAQAKAWLVRHG